MPKTEVSYAGAHKRAIAHYGGPAKERACVFCRGTATDYAYSWSGGDDERRSEDGAVWSVNPADYVPLCRADHSLMDHAHRRGEPVTVEMLRVAASRWTLAELVAQEEHRLSQWAMRQRYEMQTERFQRKARRRKRAEKETRWITN